MRLVALLLLVGCTSQPESEATWLLTDAERIFVTDVFPKLQANCAGCHDGTADAGFEVAFLAGKSWREVRDSLFVTGVVSLDPTTSPLLTKGVHAGPTLAAHQVLDIVKWLEAERDAF